MTNVTTNRVRRELSIASSFVKQYYTLLNKAPHFIHNFYSAYSTFIHGAIEIGNDHHTEPVTGREEIKRKIEDLKLNDCRAKIIQIDCLDSLAGGLVIQVVGELSNNGKPMRRFLQTFVLAPGPDDGRNQDGDNNQPRTNRDVSNVPSHNQKFFVLNSIFRYQDDGREAEFEGDSGCHDQQLAATESTNGEADNNRPEHKVARAHTGSSDLNGSTSEGVQSRKRSTADNEERNYSDVERLANDLDDNVKFNRSINEQEVNKKEVVPNGGNNNTALTSGLRLNPEKKHDKVEGSNVDIKSNADHQMQSHVVNTTSTMSTGNQPASQPALVTRPQPMNEPKTWANAVRNAHSTSASAPIQMNSNKSTQEQQSQQTASQSISQSSLLPQQQSNSQQNQQQNTNNSSNNNNGNNRRRHVTRKPSNKSAGRAIKRDRTRPPAGKPPV